MIAYLSNLTDIDFPILKDMYITMIKIRKAEEAISDLISKKKIICPCHLYIGQEAIATGACHSLRKDDFVFSTHRSHGHYIAKGGDIKAMFAEIYGKETGCSKGRGGSMHLSSPGVGLPGSSAIVAGTIPMAVGSALSFSLQKKDSIAVSFFGDGATNEGVFYESMNFASLKGLPVVFICENNLYSTHMPISSCLANTSIYKIAEFFNIKGVQVNGNNVSDVYKAAKIAVDRAREGGGPTLIECLTYRWKGHVGPNDDLDRGLRSKKEIEYWTSLCPIKLLERYMDENYNFSESVKIEIDKNVEMEIEEAIAFAEESPYPDQKDLSLNVFKN